MAMFVHLALQARIAQIRRNGIRRLRPARADFPGGDAMSATHCLMSRSVGLLRRSATGQAHEVKKTSILTSVRDTSRSEPS